MRGNPLEMTAWMGVTVLVGFLVVSFGLQKGLERITKWMMLGLLGLILILAVHSLTLPGGMEGVKFYLLPDFRRAAEAGLGNVLTAAMNQAFFTLSLGIAAMEIFGSYMSRDNTLTSEAVRICVLDTFVALMAGLIIFPACFAFDVQPDQGPTLIFMILPKVFLNMTGGRLWGALFFLFMTFASFSTVIAVFENLQANAIDNFGWTRKKAALVNCVFVLVASMPCVLGYNLWSGLHLIGGRDVLDSEDFLVSNLLLPLGSLVYLLFCVSKKGWGYDRYLEEANAGEGIKMPRWLKPYFQFVLPVLILFILIQGLI
jgi:NSS family neurotransmitter:Na+ symporter